MVVTTDLGTTGHDEPGEDPLTSLRDRPYHQHEKEDFNQDNQQESHWPVSSRRPPLPYRTGTPAMAGHDATGGSIASNVIGQRSTLN